MSAFAAPALAMNATRIASRRARVLADHVRAVPRRAPTEAHRVATKANSSKNNADVEVSDEEMQRLTGLITKKIDDNDVVVWAKSWCPYCDEIKALFDDMEVAHLAVDLDKFNEEKALVSALARMTGQRTVPNVFIGGGAYRRVRRHDGAEEEWGAAEDAGGPRCVLQAGMMKRLGDD